MREAIESALGCLLVIGVSLVVALLVANMLITLGALNQ